MNLINSSDTESTNDNMPKMEYRMTEKKKTTRGRIVKILLASVLSILLIWFIWFISRPEPIEVEYDGNYITINGPFEDKDIEIALPENCRSVSLSSKHKLEEGQRLQFVSQNNSLESSSPELLRLNSNLLEWTESIDLLRSHIVIIGGTESGTELPLKRITAAALEIKGTFNELEMIEVYGRNTSDYWYENCLDGDFPSLKTLQMVVDKNTNIDGNYPSLETLKIWAYPGNIVIDGDFPKLNSVNVSAYAADDGIRYGDIRLRSDFPVLNSLSSSGGTINLYFGKYPLLKSIECTSGNTLRTNGGTSWDNLTKIRGGVLEIELLDTSFPKLTEIECDTINFAVDSSKLTRSGDFPNYTYNIPYNTEVFAREIKKTMPILENVTVRREATTGFNVIEEALVRLADDGIITLNLLYK